jgi:hypothetical protein
MVGNGFTAGGRIKAGAVVIACGGYIEGLHRKLAGALQSVATYVMVTEPLGDRLRTAIRGNQSVIDSRFDFDYYRPLLDTRIMWGGGITIRRSDPPDLRQMMLKKLLTVYPQLEGVRVETAWTGLMGYPKHKMPQLGEVSPGVWYAMVRRPRHGHHDGNRRTGRRRHRRERRPLQTLRPLRPRLDRRRHRPARGGDDLPVLPLQGLAKELRKKVTADERR